MGHAATAEQLALSPLRTGGGGDAGAGWGWAAREARKHGEDRYAISLSTRLTRCTARAPQLGSQMGLSGRSSQLQQWHAHARMCPGCAVCFVAGLGV
jgi:hypothetical protein